MPALALGVRRIGVAAAGIDRVVVLIAAVFGALVIAAPGLAGESLGLTLSALVNVAPWLALSVALAAYAAA